MRPIFYFTANPRQSHSYGTACFPLYVLNVAYEISRVMAMDEIQPKNLQKQTVLIITSQTLNHRNVLTFCKLFYLTRSK